MGSSFWRLAHRDGQTEDPGAERRFAALLNAHPDELDRHLRHAVSLLGAHEVSIDWAQLLRDVQEWGYEERPVQRAWAQAFWGAGSGRDAEPETAEAGTGDQGASAAPATTSSS